MIIKHYAQDAEQYSLVGIKEDNKMLEQIMNAVGNATLIAAMMLFLISIISTIVNKLIGWKDPKTRKIIFYYIKNKKKIDETIEKLYMKK